jgi:hypothetical protein
MMCLGISARNKVALQPPLIQDGNNEGVVDTGEFIALS